MGKIDTPYTRALAAARIDAIETRAINWCVWKAAVPAVLIWALLPFYQHIMTLDHPFQHAFAHADFILFAAILLFEIGVEADCSTHQPRYLRVASSLTKAIAALLMALYWVIRRDVIEREQDLVKEMPPGAHHAILEKLTSYAWLSCGIGGVSLVSAAILVIAVVDHQKKEELREFGVLI